MAIPARWERTTLSRKSERISRTCSTGLLSHALTCFRPAGVASYMTR